MLKDVEECWSPGAACSSNKGSGVARREGRWSMREVQRHWARNKEDQCWIGLDCGATRKAAGASDRMLVLFCLCVGALSRPFEPMRLECGYLVGEGMPMW